MEAKHIVRGQVIRGKGRGHKLRFPTANLKLYHKIPVGIYVSEVILGSCTFKAATFVGTAKTFNENVCQMECHILDFEENIYGSFITIKLYEKIRENIKFDCEADLILQMEKDILDVKNFFK